MKIAIPSSNGKLCMHFGHCDVFDIFDVDSASKKVIKKETQTPPPHEPGVLPQWLSSQNVTCIIAGGMGGRAQQLFQQNNIQVITGAPSDSTESIVDLYLNDKLVTGDNTCDH
jgi:predicted Fe-Mo cluster-binding NifX family protein